MFPSGVAVKIFEGSGWYPSVGPIMMISENQDLILAKDNYRSDLSVYHT